MRKTFSSARVPPLVFVTVWLKKPFFWTTIGGEKFGPRSILETKMIRIIPKKVVLSEKSNLWFLECYSITDKKRLKIPMKDIEMWSEVEKYDCGPGTGIY